LSGQTLRSHYHRDEVRLPSFAVGRVHG
jgi:hypothetical protein